MRHSQRRAIAQKEREFLKGNDTESPRYRHAVLTGVREAKNCAELAVICILLVALAALEQRADYLAAAGATIAVVGVVRFRTGYVNQVMRNNAAHPSKLPTGDDDAVRSEAQIVRALSRTERNGLALAAFGTLVNGFSGLIGHYFHWVN